VLPRGVISLLRRTAAFVLFAAIACWAQRQNPPARAPSPSPDAPPSNSKRQAATGNPRQTAADGEKKKPKKIWTNDELGSVSGPVNVVGEASASSGGVKTSSARPSEARQQMIESYRSQIQQAQEQIDAADKRIAQLKNFKADNTNPSGGINPNQGYNMVPLEEQVRQLEDKKKKLQSKIDEIENDARKNGIEPGELR
jgi:hypothetical protein